MNHASRLKGIAAGALGLGGLAVAWLAQQMIETTSEQTADAALGPISKRIEQLEKLPKTSSKELQQLNELREIRAEMEQELQRLAVQRPWNADRLEGGAPS